MPRFAARRLLLALILPACAPRGGPGTVSHPLLVSTLLARADSDGDGRIEAEEYARVGELDEPIGRYDLDHDGALSPPEIEAAFLHTDPISTRNTHLPVPLPTAP